MNYALFSTFAAINFIKMENQEKNTVQKARSYRGILTAGVYLYTQAFRKFFKASWLMALLYALVFGACCTMAALKIPEITVAVMAQIQKFNGIFIEPLQHYSIDLAIIFGLLLLSLSVQALANAPIAALLKEHLETGTITPPTSWFKPNTRLMLRSLKGILLTVGIITVCFIIMILILVTLEWLISIGLTHSPFTTTAFLLIVSAIIFAFALPIINATMKYILQSGGYWKTIGRYYGCGMRHWGSLFLVFFVSGLLTWLVGVVIMLPANILFLANFSAQMGQLLGDPLGMPSYMPILTYVTFVLCIFIFFYVSLTLMLHNYYTYGAIEAKEAENEQQKLDIQ